MSDHQTNIQPVQSQPVELPPYEQLSQMLGPGVCKRLGIYPVPKDLVLSVVIPVYNERETLHLLLDRVRAVRHPRQSDCAAAARVRRKPFRARR